MKRRIFLIAVITIILSLTALGSWAYFTAEDTAHNVITSGNIDIQLLEWADEARSEAFPTEGISGVMPGTAVTKIVEVKNTGAGDAWVRVRAVKNIVLADGIDSNVDLGLMVLDFDTEKWVERDGYFYYILPLAPGETTVPLFASVTFDEKMDNRYQNATATVDVDVFAVQAANNGSTVLDAQGWPAG